MIKCNTIQYYQKISIFVKQLLLLGYPPSLSLAPTFCHRLVIRFDRFNSGGGIDKNGDMETQPKNDKPKKVSMKGVCIENQLNYCTASGLSLKRYGCFTGWWGEQQQRQVVGSCIDGKLIPVCCKSETALL